MLRIPLLAGLVACAPKAPPAPVAPPAVTQVYALHPADAIVMPPKLPSLMAEGYELTLLLAATTAEGQLSVVLATATPEGPQDRCVPTTRLDAALDATGAFQITDARFGFSSDNVPASLQGARLAGQVTAEALLLGDVRGHVDTRAFLTFLGTKQEDAMCEMLKVMAPCEPCPDGSGDRCWAVTLTDARAVPVTQTVEERTPEAIAADPACAR